MWYDYTLNFLDIFSVCYKYILNLFIRLQLTFLDACGIGIYIALVNVGPVPSERCT